MNSQFGTISLEIRLLIIVTAGGLLGSSLRSSGLLILRQNESMGRYLNMEILWRGAIGVPFSAFAYLLLRGILLTPNTPIKYINNTGMLVLAILIGFFSFEMWNGVSKMLLHFSEKESRLEDKIEKISSTLGVNLLDNFEGYFNYKIDVKYHTSSNTILQFTCFFSRYPQFAVGNLSNYDRNWRSNEGRSDEVKIVGGNDIGEVNFVVVPYIGIGNVSPSKSLLTVTKKEPQSENLQFEFNITGMEYRKLWFEILQKNRLIAVITPQIDELLQNRNE